MGFLKEFKEFAVKGNMIDIAIGVIIGSAFNKVIDVIVKDIFLPPLSYLTSGVNWTDKKIVLSEKIMENGEIITEEIAIGYGKLFATLIDFLIIGLTVFIVVKAINSIKRKAQDVKNTDIPTPKDIELLSKMTELLEKQIEITEQNSNTDNN